MLFHESWIFPQQLLFYLCQSQCSRHIHIVLIAFFKWLIFVCFYSFPGLDPMLSSNSILMNAKKPGAGKILPRKAQANSLLEASATSPQTWKPHGRCGDAGKATLAYPNFQELRMVSTCAMCTMRNRKRGILGAQKVTLISRVHAMGECSSVVLSNSGQNMHTAFCKGQKHVLVCWSGHGPANDTWEKYTLFKLECPHTLCGGLLWAKYNLHVADL